MQVKEKGRVPLEFAGYLRDIAEFSGVSVKGSGILAYVVRFDVDLHLCGIFKIILGPF